MPEWVPEGRTLSAGLLVALTLVVTVLALQARGERGRTVPSTTAIVAPTGAADPLLACVLAGLGVTSLSMGAASIPYVRATLAKHTLAQCERAASAARAADAAQDAHIAAQAVLSGE